MRKLSLLLVALSLASLTPAGAEMRQLRTVNLSGAFAGVAGGHLSIQTRAGRVVGWGYFLADFGAVARRSDPSAVSSDASADAQPTMSIYRCLNGSCTLFNPTVQAFEVDRATGRATIAATTSSGARVVISWSPRGATETAIEGACMMGETTTHHSRILYELAYSLTGDPLSGTTGFRLATASGSYGSYRMRNRGCGFTARGMAGSVELNV